ncbi:hypothetical protein ACWD11_22770 [Streptomyces sp. NPDC002776]
MYRAKETFWAPDNRRIVKGDLVAAHDPVVTGREDLFEAVVIPQALTPAEAATAQESEHNSDSPEATAGDTAASGQAPSKEAAGAAATAPGDGSGRGDQPQPAAAAKKTAAKKPTPVLRKPAGGDAQ